MTKFIKTLIIINGLVIPITILIILIVIITQAIQNSSRRYRPEVINTENTITKDGDTLVIQGLRYDDPRSIYNSTNFIIKVLPKTYDRPRKLEKNPVNFEGGSSYSSRGPNESYLNILFLDSQYNVFRRLVDKKASIESVTIPTGYNEEKVDTTVKNIAYLITFDDTNDDKRIDWNDNYDLYISDLDGGNLIQVTKDIDIMEFDFINDHKDLFISYTDRTETRDEYKNKRFAVFNIQTKKFRKLTSIDNALVGIQKILN